jgi:hypothetical protein
MAIDSLHSDCLSYIFSFLTIKDLCAVSRVCKRWYRWTQDKTWPLNVERLEKIAYHNISQFDRLPRVRLDLKLRTFTVFQGIIVGETGTDNLCIYYPGSGEVFFLDYQPPIPSKFPGDFLTSSQACVFRNSGQNFYQIDVQAKSCQRIDFQSSMFNYALLKRKLYCWQIATPKYEWFSEQSREQQKYSLYPYVEMEVFDLEDQYKTEVVYRTHKRPKVYVSEDRFIIRSGIFLDVLDENLKTAEDCTSWHVEAFNIHLRGKKILFEGCCHMCGRDKSWTQDYVAIKDIGDCRNYGEETINLPVDSIGKLHCFFREGLGWRFLRFDGIEANRVIWFLSEGNLTYMNLASRIVLT